MSGERVIFTGGEWCGLLYELLIRMSWMRGNGFGMFVVFCVGIPVSMLVVGCGRGGVALL